MWQTNSACRGLSRSNASTSTSGYSLVHPRPVLIASLQHVASRASGRRICVSANLVFLDVCHSLRRARPLYQKYGLGTTVFSALASGLLTGKVSPTQGTHTHACIRVPGAHIRTLASVQQRHPCGLAVREPRGLLQEHDQQSERGGGPEEDREGEDAVCLR